MRRRLFESKKAFQRRKYAEDFELDQRAILERRMKKIKDLANEAMKTAHPGRHVFPVRDNVVISYNDLLAIWNQADLTLSDF